MKDQRLTTEQVLRIYHAHKYVAMREADGYEIAINTRITRTAIFKQVATPSRKKWRTRFVSCRPISFHEYISIKLPFVLDH